MKELDINFTEDQKIALDDMLKWVSTPTDTYEDLFYLLSGFAGTGKTFLLKYFVQLAKLKNIVATAPTHKAKKVIADQTGLPSETIQSLLGLRPDVNMEFFNINRPTFNPLAPETIGNYRYVIIDESSMLNKDAYELIINRATLKTVRIIFLGDSYQLPPIKEVISKVFTNIKHSSYLTTIVRQEENNPNIKLLNLIRNDIKFNTSKSIEYIYKNPSAINDKGEGYLALTPENFTKALTTKFCETDAMYDIDYIRYISYTNKSVTAGCKGIRNKRIGKDSDIPIVKEDFMLGYNTVSLKNIILLENSEDYTIKDIDYEIQSEAGIKCFSITLTNSFGFSTNVNVVNPLDYANFLDVFRLKLNTAKKYKGKQWEKYYEFKNQHLLLDDIYFENGKLEVKKDLYYGYGITTHKSQGSTYKNVAVNIRNILTNRNIRERNKLLYVALSRTSGLNILNI